MGCAMPPHFMPSKRSHAPSRCSNTSVIKCEPLYMSVAMSLYLPTTVCLTISSCCSFGCNLYYWRQLSQTLTPIIGQCQPDCAVRTLTVPVDLCTFHGLP